MLQKLALAVKTKTIEFFAEDDDGDEEDNASFTALDLDPAAEEIITGQRVVVIKPDQPNKPKSPKLRPTTAAKALPILDRRNPQLQRSLVSSVFTAVASFHAAYLQLQTSQEPLDPEAIESADRIAVSHLQRLSDLKKAYYEPPESSKSDPMLLSELAGQVQENQSMLRMFETIFNRLQSDIDHKDAEVSALRNQLKEIQKGITSLKKNMGGLRSSTLIEEEKAFLSVGVFEAILKDSRLAVHRFTGNFIHLMKSSNWDLNSAANSIYSDVIYAKKGHCRYALLSYICLNMFNDFGTSKFGLSSEWSETNDEESAASRKKHLNRFLEQLTVDAMEILISRPQCDFAKFCQKKYKQIVHPIMESSLLGEVDLKDPAFRSWQHSNPLYEPFVAMCSSLWTLHLLALAFDRPVEIFQVPQGANFSMVYMENVVRKARSKDFRFTNSRPKVGFTVFPGFHVGKVTFQCRVYLNYVKYPV